LRSACRHMSKRSYKALGRHHQIPRRDFLPGAAIGAGRVDGEQPTFRITCQSAQSLRACRQRKEIFRHMLANDASVRLGSELFYPVDRNERLRTIVPAWHGALLTAFGEVVHVASEQYRACLRQAHQQHAVTWRVTRCRVDCNGAVTENIMGLRVRNFNRLRLFQYRIGTS